MELVSTWVTVWVNQLTNTKNSKITIKKSRKPTFSRKALYDKNDVKLLSSGVMTDQDGGSIPLLELENTTDHVVYVSTSDIWINGLVVSSFTWSIDEINPGKR